VKHREHLPRSALQHRSTKKVNCTTQHNTPTAPASLLAALCSLADSVWGARAEARTLVHPPRTKCGRRASTAHPSQPKGGRRASDAHPSRPKGGRRASTAHPSQSYTGGAVPHTRRNHLRGHKHLVPHSHRDQNARRGSTAHPSRSLQKHGTVGLHTRRSCRRTPQVRLIDILQV